MLLFHPFFSQREYSSSIWSANSNPGLWDEEEINKKRYRLLTGLPPKSALPKGPPSPIPLTVPGSQGSGGCCPAWAHSQCPGKLRFLSDPSQCPHVGPSDSPVYLSITARQEETSKRSNYFTGIAIGLKCICITLKSNAMMVYDILLSG